MEQTAQAKVRKKQTRKKKEIGADSAGQGVAIGMISQHSVPINVRYTTGTHQAHMRAIIVD